MKVRIVGGGTGDLGATRYKIEWLTIKPDVNAQDGIDPDTDTDTHIEYRPEQALPQKPDYSSTYEARRGFASKVTFSTDEQKAPPVLVTKRKTPGGSTRIQKF